MKLLGHAWVAVHAVPQGNRPQLMAGSLIPEVLYYTNQSYDPEAFTFEEIHEGGISVYSYLMNNNPLYKDIGLGMMSHSERTGADYFNSDEKLQILGYSNEETEKFVGELAHMLRLSDRYARERRHNIFELAVDLGIIKRHPDFVAEFSDMVGNNSLWNEISDVLSVCFSRTREFTGTTIEELRNKMNPSYFTSAEGLALLWNAMSSSLPEEQRDTVDVPALAAFLENRYTEYAGRDMTFMNEAIGWTKEHLILQHRKERDI